MKLSIIVTHYKTPQILSKSVSSLVAAADGISHEIIISDSESGSRLNAEIIKRQPKVRVLAHERNVGYGRLVNDAFHEAKGEYLLVLNADIIIPGTSLAEWLNFMDKRPSIGVSGPKLVNLDGTLQYSCFRFYKPLTILARRTAFGRTRRGRRLLARFLMYDYERRVARDVDWLMGSALLIRRAAYEKVGDMDPRFFMYFEDVDWCRRCWQAGYRVVYNPKIELTHYHMKASDSKGGFRDIFTNRLTRVHIASALKYFLKYFSKPLPIH